MGESEIASVLLNGELGVRFDARGQEDVRALATLASLCPRCTVGTFACF